MNVRSVSRERRSMAAVSRTVARKVVLRIQRKFAAADRNDPSGTTEVTVRQTCVTIVQRIVLIVQRYVALTQLMLARGKRRASAGQRSAAVEKNSDHRTKKCASDTKKFDFRSKIKLQHKDNWQ